MLPGNRDELLPRQPRKIAVRGARTHNLQGIDVDIPHGKLTVVTGLSGSGKSSLVFDTIFAEGQRQYVNSLATQTRRLVDILPKPPVDSISGLQPTLCIEQRAGDAHSRSTVATLAEIYDYLRLLMARVGTPYCHACGALIRQQPCSEIIADILKNPEGTKLTIMAPIVRGRKGNHHDAFAAMTKAGLVKARVDGELFEIEEAPSLAPTKKHDIEAVCDRIILRPGCQERIEAAVQVALKLADGLVSTNVIVPAHDGSRDSTGTETTKLYSTKYACPDCGLSYAEIEPRIFSFNSPYGACPDCKGNGIVDKSEIPSTLNSSLGREVVVEGDVLLDVVKPTKEPLRLNSTVCAACNGTRLRPESRSIFLNTLSIDRITAMTVEQAVAWFKSIKLEGLHAEIAKPILAELYPRLEFLNRIGVGYLQLDRPANTLSGGEFQRVRLATGLGSGLIGVCYILDEPSIGLHPRDGRRLIETLHDLRDRGNTLLVVEHDPQVMLSADFLIDMGPGAGKLGGKILASGTPSEVALHSTSITAPFLKQELGPRSDRTASPRKSDQSIRIEGACARNLQSINVEFPLGCLIGVTGVSGSGKSTLVLETLVPIAEAFLKAQSPSSPLARSEGTKLGGERHFESSSIPWIREVCTSITGLDQLDKLIVVDQQPIGRTARSTPATYTGVWDLIREALVQTREAKQRGFKSNRFSFNAGPGRCESCLGLGQRTIEMGFMADVYAPCESCRGKRFNRPTLSVRYKEKNIADILAMTVDEAADFFANFTKISAILEAMKRVGLGYVTLGQPSQTLSGGEAQRIKLATELSRPSTGRTLYVFDEPTTGLHPLDVEQLMKALQGLVDLGNTVIVIEHHLDVVRQCDWLIDLGPEGGPLGGHLTATGTLESIISSKKSWTGRALLDSFETAR